MGDGSWLPFALLVEVRGRTRDDGSVVRRSKVR